MDNIPMRPPKLPGYDFVQMLGSGATATVYLYNQRMPARPVAVKASAKTLDPRAAALFNREANFMAKLSSHPYILPVYGAGVTSDGHGYIVIEYAPGRHLQQHHEGPVHDLRAGTRPRHQAVKRAVHRASQQYHPSRHQAQQHSHHLAGLACSG